MPLPLKKSQTAINHTKFKWCICIIAFCGEIHNLRQPWAFYRTTMPKGMAEPSAMEIKTMPYPSKRVWIVGCIALAACGPGGSGVVFVTDGVLPVLSRNARVSGRTDALIARQGRTGQSHWMLTMPHSIGQSGSYARRQGMDGHQGLVGTTWRAAQTLTAPPCSPLPVGLRTMPTAAPATRT